MKPELPELKNQLMGIVDQKLLYPIPRELFSTNASHVRQNTLLRRAAVSVLFCGDRFLDSKVLLTERSLTLPTHSGQVAFPGGMLEPADQGDSAQAALRECEEEVGVSKSLVQVLGVLPSFPTLTGDFDVVPVIGMLQRRELPPFHLSDEVTVAEWVSVSALIQSKFWEERTVSQIQLKTPCFMWGERKMWGLSAWIFDLILKRYDTIFSI